MASDTKTESTESTDPESATAEPSERLPGGPRVLPLVALRETVIFPEMIVPLQVGREKSVKALDTAVGGDSLIALVTQRQAEREEQDTRVDQHGRQQAAHLRPVEYGQRTDDQDGAEGAGAGDVPEVRETGEAPQALVQARGPEDQSLHQGNQEQLGNRGQGVDDAERSAAVDDPAGGQPGQDYHRQVVRDHGRTRVTQDA